MTDRAKWAGIYLLLCSVPFFVYFRSSALTHDITAHAAVTDFLFFVPYVGLGLIAVLGLQINQTRIFWAALFFFGLYHYLWHPATFLTLDIQRVKSFEIIAAAFPLTLCVIFLMKECRLWSDQSLARFFLALTPFLVFICLSSWAPDLFSELFYWRLLAPTGSLRIPNLTWATSGIFLLVVIYLPDPKIKGFLTALATTLIPLFFTLQANLLNKFSNDRLSSVFYVIVSFTTITLILLHAVLHTYWKKVYQDVLTGVPNRQALDERLHTLSGSYALSMVDIDHFKKFNDTYGHAEGDNVLRMVAMHLQDALGPRVYRYGGEEFCVVFEKPNGTEAEDQMDKARSTLYQRKFTLRIAKRRKSENRKNSSGKSETRGKEVRISFSAGVAAAKENQSVEDVIKRADQALYRAKDNGRNCVVADK